MTSLMIWENSGYLEIKATDSEVNIKNTFSTFIVDSLTSDKPAQESVFTNV